MVVMVSSFSFSCVNPYILPVNAFSLFEEQFKMEIGWQFIKVQFEPYTITFLDNPSQNVHLLQCIRTCETFLMKLWLVTMCFRLLWRHVMLKWYFLTIKIRKGVNSNQVRYYHSENINFTLIHKYIADLGFRLWYIFCLSNFKDCNHHLILKICVAIMSKWFWECWLWCN